MTELKELTTLLRSSCRPADYDTGVAIFTEADLVDPGDRIPCFGQILQLGFASPAEAFCTPINDWRIEHEDIHQKPKVEGGRGSLTRDPKSNSTVYVI